MGASSRVSSQRNHSRLHCEGRARYIAHFQYDERIVKVSEREGQAQEETKTVDAPDHDMHSVKVTGLRAYSGYRVFVSAYTIVGNGPENTVATLVDTGEDREPFLRDFRFQNYLSLNCWSLILNVHHFPRKTAISYDSSMDVSTILLYSKRSIILPETLQNVQISVPGPPQYFGCSFVSENEVRLKWLPPAYPNGKIQSYVVSYWRATETRASAIDAQVRWISNQLRCLTNPKFRSPEVCWCFPRLACSLLNNTSSLSKRSTQLESPTRTSLKSSRRQLEVNYFIVILTYRAESKLPFIEAPSPRTSLKLILLSWEYNFQCPSETLQTRCEMTKRPIHPTRSASPGKKPIRMIQVCLEPSLKNSRGEFRSTGPRCAGCLSEGERR